MRTNDSFLERKQPTTSHCNQEFLNEEGTLIVNSYVCSDRKFSVSDLWNIDKQKRQFSIRNSQLN